MTQNKNKKNIVSAFIWQLIENIKQFKTRYQNVSTKPQFTLLALNSAPVPNIQIATYNLRSSTLRIPAVNCT
jgi:hypothetical protein